MKDKNFKQRSFLDNERTIKDIKKDIEKTKGSLDSFEEWTKLNKELKEKEKENNERKKRL